MFCMKPHFEKEAQDNLEMAYGKKSENFLSV